MKLVFPFILLLCISLPVYADNVIRYSPDNQVDKSFKPLTQPVRLQNQKQAVQPYQAFNHEKPKYSIDFIALWFTNLIIDTDRYNPYVSKNALFKVIKRDLLEQCDEEFLLQISRDCQTEKGRFIHGMAFLERYDELTEEYLKQREI